MLDSRSGAIVLFEDIVHETANVMDVRITFIYGQMRSHAIVRARWIIMYLARTRLDLSYPQIGKLLNRHHTTVINGVKQISSSPHLTATCAQVWNRVIPE